MQKLLNRLLFSFILGVVITACANNDSSKNLDKWVGKYNYNEEPIKATAGYCMVMNWKLSINKQGNAYLGILEVNGQQTNMKLSADILGDTSTIAIVYNKLIDGSEGILKKGDTLFLLSGSNGMVKTKWKMLEPRLAEHPPTECSCFQ